MTRGREIETHAIVMLDAVCDQPATELVDCAFATELDATRLVSELEDDNSGESGVGDAVERREDFRGEPLVGEASGGGNSEGCWRVDTMVTDGRREVTRWKRKCFKRNWRKELFQGLL